MKTNEDIQGQNSRESSVYIAVNPARRTIATAMALILLFLFCASGVYAGDFEPVHATVTRINQFGAIVFDLNGIDLAYGDSVDVVFSGGYQFKAIPFYPDFYGKMDDVALTVFQNALVIGGVARNPNLTARIEPGETAVITLEQKGRYREEFEAYNTNDATYRAPGQTDEDFLNAREVTVGAIQPGRLYRGSSPFDAEYGRVELMGAYIATHNIRAVLNLADSQERLEAIQGLPAYTASLFKQGRVIPCHLGIDFLDPKTMQGVGKGFSELTELELPWLIHCSLGRDRTGAVCAVVEALCGASYDEIVQDYMTSYDTLHNIEMNPDSLQYRLFKLRIDEILAAIAEIEIEQLPHTDLHRAAVGYLLRCGMTQAQIDRLVGLLTEPCT